MIGEGPARALRRTTAAGTVEAGRRGTARAEAVDEGGGGRERGAVDRGRRQERWDAGGDGGSGDRRSTRLRGRWRPHLSEGREGSEDAGEEAGTPAGTVGSQISVRQRRPNGEEKQTGTMFFGCLNQLGSRDPGSRLVFAGHLGHLGCHMALTWR
ncbi:hypothetical protein Syun_020527 [Stephania yunnanensis]|uniref:Uncharacterized protein n=1 Tax=Stephania yunnanensis TaxID=152371 RepID=A0AAP0IEN2_9MAGN